MQRVLNWVLGVSVALFMALPALAGGEKLEQQLRTAFEAGELDGVHAVLVLKGGAPFAEVYFEGRDERWGTPLGVRQHGPEEIHDLRSVTKSIVGLLYGIALSEGKVPDLDAPLMAQFPQYPELMEEPDRQAITVRDALNMTMGVEWNEDLPYSDPRNSEIQMERAEDRIRYALSQPIIGPPGQTWVYNGGATAIIGELIEAGTGERLEDYARRVLFDPLGIGKTDWVKGYHGRASAASGLRMTAPDLAKIGQMIDDGGRAGGQQVVPQDWLTATFSPTVFTSDGLRYAHFWWQAADGTPPRWVAGFGNGGQRLTVAPGLDVVVVMFAGNYNQPDAWRVGVKVMVDFVIPAVTSP